MQDLSTENLVLKHYASSEAELMLMEVGASRKYQQFWYVNIADELIWLQTSCLMLKSVNEGTKQKRQQLSQ